MHLGHLYRQCTAQLLNGPDSQVRNTHRIHVDRFQIIRVRITRFLRTIRIDCASNLEELLREVRQKFRMRNRKRSVCAMSPSPIRNLICLDLRFLDLRPSVAQTLFLIHLSQERNKVV